MKKAIVHGLEKDSLQVVPITWSLLGPSGNYPVQVFIPCPSLVLTVFSSSTVFPSVLLSCYFTLFLSFISFLCFFFNCSVILLSSFWLSHFHSLVGLLYIYFVHYLSVFFTFFTFYLYHTSCVQVWPFLGLQAPIQVTQHTLVCSCLLLIYKCAFQDHGVPFIVHHTHWFTLYLSPRLLLHMSLTVFTPTAYSSVLKLDTLSSSEMLVMIYKTFHHSLENSKHQ